MANQIREPSVLKTDTSKLPSALLEKLEKIFEIESIENSSNSLPPYTFSFATSNVTALLFDYSYHLKKLSMNDIQRKTRDFSLAWLQEFVRTSEAPYILFLGSKVDDILPSFAHDIRRSICKQINAEKTVLYGFSTSWKDVATHLFEISEKLGQVSLEAEDFAYKSELERLMNTSVFFDQTE